MLQDKSPAQEATGLSVNLNKKNTGKCKNERVKMNLKHPAPSSPGDLDMKEMGKHTLEIHEIIATEIKNSMRL